MVRRPAVLARLAQELHRVDRLVLLGDVIELMERRATRAMALAEPVMRELAAALPSHGEVLIVPGNHDRPLIRPWLRQVRPELSLDTFVPCDATPALARVCSWLSPHRVEVRYPGVWLGEGVWATHGHYLDRHLFPESAVGIARGLLRRPARDVATPLDYERSQRPSTASVTGVLPRWVQAGVEDLAELIRASTMPGVRRRLLNRRIAPLTSMLLGVQMRRASIPALARVVQRLEVQADWVVFGHVHRAGPLLGEDPREWVGPGGSPQVLNAGSWLYEPLLVHRATPPHPYWPGGAVLIDSHDRPRAIGLLDDLDEQALVSR